MSESPVRQHTAEDESTAPGVPGDPPPPLGAGAGLKEAPACLEPPAGGSRAAFAAGGVHSEHAADADAAADDAGPLHAALEYAMFFAFPFMFVAVAYFSAARLHELRLLWLVAVAVPASVVLGDFVTGLVHWAADTYGTDETPVIGQSLVRPFRLHHLRPTDMCAHGLVTTVGNTCILAFPLLSLCLYLLLGRGPAPAWLAFATFVAAALCLVTVATNQFHKWAHQDEPARAVRWLQRARLVLGPSNHRTHHTEPFDDYYCITNGWMNPVLGRVKFFRGLEAALRLLGIRPTGRPE